MLDLLLMHRNNIISMMSSKKDVTGTIYNFDYTGTFKEINMLPGTYKLEVWGAQGGYRNNIAYGGNGGYSIGTLTLDSLTKMYIYPGGSGNTNGANGGFNGGGKRYTVPGGGGASDIRLEQNSLYARVIVAGGGGSDGASNKGGGYGGGISGTTTTNGYGEGGFGGGQTGVLDYTWQTSNPTNSTINKEDAFSGFGFGGNGIYRGNGYGGAGGGGWYGGSGVYPDYSGDDDKGGGGGSGYIYTESTYKNYPSGCLLNYKYYLTDATTYSGNSIFNNPEGKLEIGHSGNGFVRITVLSGYGIAN